MKIVRIEINNYGTFYGLHTFDFTNRGLILVIGDNRDEPRMDSNGAGKSQLFDALDWCVFGVVPRGDHADSIFNDEAWLERGSECWVRVYFEDDNGLHASIRRGRTKSGNTLDFNLGGVDQKKDDKTTLDTAETQKLIERFLGLDREVFHAAVLFGQTDMVHYAESKDAARMEILTKILQLDDIDVYLENAKAQVKAAKVKDSEYQTKIAALNGQLNGLRSVNYDAQIAAWEKKREQDLETLAGAIRTRKEMIAKNEVELQQEVSLRQQLALLTAELNGLAKPQESQTELDNARKLSTDIRVNLSTNQGLRASLVLECDRFRKMGEGVCSNCGQPVTGQYLQKEIQIRTQKIAEIDKPIAEGTANLQHAQAQEQQFATQVQKQDVFYQGVVREKSQAVAAIQQSVNRMTEVRNGVLAIQAEVQKLGQDWEEKKAASNPFIDQAEATKTQIAALELERLEVVKFLEAVQERNLYLDFWVNGFGAKGLKSYILDSRLQELTDAANEWVRLLTGGTIWVRFEAQKQQRGSKKVLVNAPDIRVFRWNPDNTITERNYKSWSGGEKQRIAFGVDFGLSRLIAQRAKQRYDILILDEISKHLDRSGKEAVVEMLGLLAQEKSSLFVVEHDEVFQNQFENKVLARKENRRTTLWEIDDAGNAQEKKEAVGLQVGAAGQRKPVRAPVRRPVTG